MKLHWFGHACFMLESADGRAVLDPYEPGSVPGLSMPEPLEAEKVLCSHGHHDHGYTNGVKLSGKESSFKISALRCFHDEAQGSKRGNNLIHIIDAEDLRFVHMGDLGHEPDENIYAALGKVDVLMIPVGGFFTVNAAAAHSIARKIGAKLTIPMHYRGDGFGYDVIGTVEEFTKLCDNVEYADSSALELSADTLPAEKRILVLPCPAV